jgi:hypothetical protein
MKNIRGLAGTLTVCALVGLAGCVVPTTGTGGSTPTPRPTATTGTNTGGNTGTNTGGKTGTASPAPTASMAPVNAFKCETPAASNEAEPNNDFDQAQTVTACATLTASTAAGDEDDEDFYKVTIPAGLDGTLKVKVTEATEALYTVTIYDDTKTERGYDAADAATTNPFEFMHRVTGGKTYYLKVLDQNDRSEQYKLDITFEPVVDAFEPNNTYETAKTLTLGQATNLILFAGDQTNDGSDEDYFMVTVPAGKTKLTVKVANKSTKDAAQLHTVTLFDAGKNEEGYHAASGGQADFSHTYDVAPGTYYLKVTDQNSADSDVASQMTVTAE